MRYRVVQCAFNRGHDNWFVDSRAKALQEEFGLYDFGLQEITQLWLEYSEKFAAGWLIPSKGAVEEVFSVKLEPIE